jgi:DNA-binding NarL/FixJ family response regulator
MDRYRIMIVDDHVLFRQGLRKIIEEVATLNVIAEAGNGAELRTLLIGTSPQMVILDLSMPDSGGIEAVREVKTKHPHLKVLVLTMHKEYLHHALSVGADGYLLKEDADRELFSAIEGIRRGEVYLSPRLREDLRASPAGSPDPLSVREHDVLKLIAAGRTNREIADALFISIRTVETHRAHIMAKLGLSSTADVVKYAVQNGYG